MRTLRTGCWRPHVSVAQRLFPCGTKALIGAQISAIHIAATVPLREECVPARAVSPGSATKWGVADRNNVVAEPISVDAERPLFARCGFELPCPAVVTSSRTMLGCIRGNPFEAYVVFLRSRVDFTRPPGAYRRTQKNTKSHTRCAAVLD